MPNDYQEAQNCQDSVFCPGITAIAVLCNIRKCDRATLTITRTARIATKIVLLLSLLVSKCSHTQTNNFLHIHTIRHGHVV